MLFNHFELHTNPSDEPLHAIEVVVTGEVDAANAATFTRAVHELPGARPLIVNISQAKHFDSAGFAALDRLLAEQVAVLVIDPASSLFAAAQLICLPTHPSCNDARLALHQRF